LNVAPRIIYYTNDRLTTSKKIRKKLHTQNFVTQADKGTTVIVFNVDICLQKVNTFLKHNSTTLFGT